KDFWQTHVHAAGHLAIKADFALKSVELLPHTAKDFVCRLDLDYHRGRRAAFDGVSAIVVQLHASHAAQVANAFPNHRRLHRLNAGTVQRTRRAQHIIEPVSRNLSSVARGNKRHRNNWTAKALDRLEHVDAMSFARAEG